MFGGTSGMPYLRVWVNCYQAMDPAVPFGGYKMSGYGRESLTIWLGWRGAAVLVSMLASGHCRPAPPGGRTQAPFVAYGIQIPGLSEKRDD
jgi:hypothetical protein